MNLKSVLDFILALPAVFSAFAGLIKWLEERFGPNWFERIQDLHAASLQWEAAQTSEERSNAVKALALAFNSHK